MQDHSFKTHKDGLILGFLEKKAAEMGWTKDKQIAAGWERQYLELKTQYEGLKK